MEWRIYDMETKIAGTIDALYKDELTNSYIICDWKRSNCIKYNNVFGQTYKSPIQNIGECNYVSYSLQLNVYKYILENVYNMPVKSMYLIVCHPDNANFIYVEVFDLQNIIKLLLNRFTKNKNIIFNQLQLISEYNKLRKHNTIIGDLPPSL